MLRAMILALGLCGALALNVRADDEKKPDEPKQKRPPLTEEQKALRKSMTEKYDANKDGKLSADERKAFSAEDKEKWSKAFPPRKKKDAA